MRVAVQPIYERGRPRPKSERLQGPSTRGRLKVLEKRVGSMGRIANCASVLTLADGLENPLLPELVDAQLIWADHQRLRIRGYEVVDGVMYAQTWDLTVL